MEISKLELEFDKRFSKYPIAALIRKELLEWIKQLLKENK